MDVNNIYGELKDGSSIVIGIGNFNNVHGLGCFLPEKKTFQIRSFANIVTETVSEFILRYESPLQKTPKKIYFSLNLKDTPQYLSIDINQGISDEKIALASISEEKTVFSIDYSSVDSPSSYRSKILAGSLFSIETKFGERDYTILWNINGFSNGDLVLFLPLTWYERQHDNICSSYSGIDTLLSRLNSFNFKGFTDDFWCTRYSFFSNCSSNEECGNCFGRCATEGQICTPNPRSGFSSSNKQYNNYPESFYICNYSEYTILSDENPQQSMSNTWATWATWIAIISIFVVLIVLAAGLIYNGKSKIKMANFFI